MAKKPAIFDNQKINNFPRKKALKALEIAKQQEKEKIESGKYVYQNNILRGRTLKKIS